jgi:cytoskeletal protein RodZ
LEQAILYITLINYTHIMLSNKSLDYELKTTRQALLLSIDDAHEALNINKEYLEMLEDPEKGVQALSRMIAPVYAHGYYRIYSQYLGLPQKHEDPQSEKVLEQKVLTVETSKHLRKPIANLKEDNAINKVISTVCALVILLTLLMLAK